jgi:hypothetical protein
LFYKFDEESNE